MARLDQTKRRAAGERKLLGLRAFSPVLAGLLCLGGPGMTHSQAQNPDYTSLHRMLVSFYGYQRAGLKTGDSKNPFYKTAPFPHSTDASGANDLSGGWYDAGDFVKFGLPFGFTVYCLLKGYDVFPRGYDDVDSWDYTGTADGIPDILGEVKLATDYLQKAVISESQIVVDVGNGSVDHQALNEDGYANSQRTSPRQTYTGAGADIAGLYSASLALMSILYREHDAAYADACLAKATAAFNFGVKNQRLSTQQNGGEFYQTETFNDKMAAAAVELYRATQDENYRTHAKNFLAKTTSHYYVLGYSDVGDLAYFEMARQGEPNVTGPWIADVNLAIRRVVTATNASTLIKGATINSDWGNAGNAGCAAFSAALAFVVTGDESYLEFARSQSHWVAGLTPFTQSYVVGFGTNAPSAPHHRNDVARLNGIRLKGGVVSGPSPNGAFDPANPQNSTWSFDGNNADNYKNTEVALNYNAGLIGALAFLRDYDKPPAGLVRIKTALKATPDNADFNAGSVAFSAEFEGSQAWKLVLTGRDSKATKTFTGTGAALAASWTGDADAGTFLAGEGVDAVIDLDGIANYHQLRAKTVVFIVNLKKQEFKAGDKVIDDFDGTAGDNTLGGKWTVFNDKAEGGASYANPTSFTAAAYATGETGKGVSLRLVGSAGAPNPYVGVRTTFNAAGTPVSLGPAKSVIFDIHGDDGGKIRVELEQPDGQAGDYFGQTITLTSGTFQRLRLPFSAFKRPEGSALTTPLSLASVTALRFTFSGEGNVRIYLDNVRIEDLEIGGASLAPRLGASGQTWSRSPGRLSFLASQSGAGAAEHWDLLDVFGRSVLPNLSRQGDWVNIPVGGMAPGRYFLRAQAAGTEPWIFPVSVP